jgi:hypothetical protein
MHTIFVSNRLSDSYRGLLIRVLEHENLGKLDSESVTPLVMLSEHVRYNLRLCFYFCFIQTKEIEDQNMLHGLAI